MVGEYYGNTENVRRQAMRNEKVTGWADREYAEAMVQEAKDTVKGLADVL